MKHILLVDDDKMNLNMARIVLCDDYKITAVMKGSQALTFLENNSCDIILLDINMPEMEVLKFWRKSGRWNSVKIFLLFSLPQIIMRQQKQGVLKPEQWIL